MYFMILSFSHNYEMESEKYWKHRCVLDGMAGRWQRVSDFNEYLVWH